MGTLNYSNFEYNTKRTLNFDKFKTYLQKEQKKNRDNDNISPHEQTFLTSVYNKIKNNINNQSETFNI
mgnify:CR=1 FL=1